MFEPTTFADQRVGMLEYLLNNTIEVMKASQGPASPLSQQLNHVQQQWLFYNVNVRRRHAAEVLGVPLTPMLNPDIASTGWIDTILRANYGLIEVCGSGLHNPLMAMEGNDIDLFRPWIQGLPRDNETVNDRSPACFFTDETNANGLPVLLIPDRNGAVGNFLHVVVLHGQISVQSLSLDHLAADWDWDKNDWHTEVFGYLNIMTRETFLRGLAEAIKNSGRGGETPTLYIPDEYSMMPPELRDAQKLMDLELANKIAAELDMAVETVAMIVRDPEQEQRDMAKALMADDAATDADLPTNDAAVADAAPEPDTHS